MAPSLAFVQGTKEIRGLALGPPEGLIVKGQFLMGLGEEEVERDLEKKGNSARGLE